MLEGIIEQGVYRKVDRENIKQMVRRGEIRLLLGTDAASEGLNLQRLGSLINLDLPWNPTRLEQRKGRIQRIGQLQDVVYIYNMRYLNSVEDRVHELLSKRLESIYQLFGQLPDVLKDVWIDVALRQDEQARQIIDAVPKQHPFEIKYHRLEKVPWESCSRVLDATDRKQHLIKGW
jgi:superfamily II DNA/RNA helicase